MLADTLSTHPYALRVVSRARPRTGNVQSDEYEHGTLKPKFKPHDAGDKGGSGQGGGT